MQTIYWILRIWMWWIIFFYLLVWMLYWDSLQKDYVPLQQFTAEKTSPLYGKPTLDTHALRDDDSLSDRALELQYVSNPSSADISPFKGKDWFSKYGQYFLNWLCNLDYEPGNVTWLWCFHAFCTQKQTGILLQMLRNNSFSFGEFTHVSHYFFLYYFRIHG